MCSSDLMIARGVGAAVYHRGPVQRRSEGRRRKARDNEKPVEQPREHPPPPSATEPVVRDRERPACQPGGHSRDAARLAAHVMRVHQVGARQHCWKGRIDRMGEIAAQPHPGTQHPDTQAAGLRERPSGAAEGDQLTFDLPSQGPGELQRIPLPAAEQAIYAKAGRSHLDDAHHTPPPVALAGNPG